MIFDATGQRFIVFGGITLQSGPDHNDAWERSPSSTAEWIPMSPLGTAPTPRYGHSATWDPVRNRMIVFGGHGIAASDALWELTLSGTPEWHLLAPSGTLPAGRYGHTAVYDAARDQILVFGGRAASLTNETWALKLSTNPPTWQLLATTGSLPGGRIQHVAIMDAPRNRMVIYGGTGQLHFQDVWTLTMNSTPLWTRALALSSIGPVTGAGAGYDGAADQMVVFGGNDGSTYSTQIRQLKLSDMTWTSVSPGIVSPAGRMQCAFAFDGASRIGMLQGGVVSTAPSNDDTWKLTMAPSPLWTKLLPAPPDPPSLTSPADGATGVIVPAPLSWSASANATSYRVQVSTSSDFTTLVFDQNVGGTSASAGGLAYSTGYYWRVSATGIAGVGQYSSVFHFTTEPVPPVPPPPVLISPADFSIGVGLPPTLVWNASSGATSYRVQVATDLNFTVLFYDQSVAGTSTSVGGLSLGGAYFWRVRAVNGGGSSAYSTVFHFATVDAPPPGAMPARIGASGIYDPLRQRFLAFGGATGGLPSGFQNDIGELKVGRDSSFIRINRSGSWPSARYAHTTIYDPVRDRVILFGGYNGSYLNDAWDLRIGSPPTASQIAPSGTSPSVRDLHSAIYDPIRDRMIVFGGNNGASNAEIWQLTLSGTPAWTQVVPVGSGPLARISHAAIYDPIGDRMLVFGGYGGGYLNDLWSLSLSGSPAWTLLTPLGTPPVPRASHSFLYDATRGRAVLYGGAAGAVSYSDCWELTLSGGPLAWTQLAPTNPGPLDRYAHLALLDPNADRMVVAWGWRIGPGLVSSIYRLQWYDEATATTLSLVSAEAREGEVEMRWQVRAAPGTTVRIDRRARESEWVTRDQQILDGSQEVRYVDRNVSAGEHLGYRLVIESDGTESDVAWVDVPAGAAFALHGFEPNPASGGARVAFSLPGPGRATLELLDVTGRRISWQEVTAGGGRRTLAIDAPLPPGLYFIRLRHDGRTLLRRGTVTR